MSNARDESIGIAVLSSTALIVLTMAGLTASTMLRNTGSSTPAEVSVLQTGAVSRLQSPIEPEDDQSPMGKRASRGEVTRPL